MLKVGAAELRAAGLSQRKAEYVQDLAVHFSEKRVHPEKWAAMQDEDVIAESWSPSAASGAGQPRCF